jgi:hypothetical protein
MSGYFNLRSARDCLEDFRRKLAGFKSDNLNVDKATACAEACWSVVEWAGHEVLAPTNHRKQLDQFKRDRLVDCPSLAYVRDLTNKRKHRKLDRKFVVKSEEHHIGDFDPKDYSRDFNISCLIIMTVDGQRFYIDDVFEECLAFWDRFFHQNNL